MYEKIWTGILLRDRPVFFAAIVSILLLVIYAIIQPSFGSTVLLLTVATAGVPLFLTILGQAVVVFGGGLDLSMGSIASVGAVVFTFWCTHHTHFNVLIGLLLALSIGAAAGFLNGLPIVIGRLAPILVTLVSLSIWQGVSLLIMPTPGGHIPQWVIYLTTEATWLGVPVIAIMGFGVLCAAIVVFSFTPWGIALISSGSNGEVARMIGLKTSQARWMSYMIAGILAALAGVFLAGSTGTGDPNAGGIYTLASIEGVILGGNSLMGGRGSLWGAVWGSVILTMLMQILFFLGVSSFYQDVVQGGLLLIALTAGAGVQRIFRERRRLRYD